MLRAPEGQTDWGVFSFGYFSLDKQRKVTRHQGEIKYLNKRESLGFLNTHTKFISKTISQKIFFSRSNRVKLASNNNN